MEKTKNILQKHKFFNGSFSKIMWFLCQNFE